ncbi:hypothetical protein B2J93_4031 [Marssonina coronariae]|uniref:DUF1776-domain-containing protein n=1 Tax=Diplocarpon coronariae TaxID=2795749 RepID=A0A218Z9J9_9HELO|nr:hypothetical protein B2J93_4031 [Marssonina coronariae]
MSADDTSLLDIIFTARKELRKCSDDIADYVERHLEKVAMDLREALSSSQWIPESARPRPPPQPAQTFRFPASPSSSIYAQVQGWVLKNKILATVIVITLGGVTYHIVRQKSNRRKRRAKRGTNGARLEVVVVAGSPSELITKSIALDLERRGFIVYIVCNSIEEEVLVQKSFSRPDIKPLMCDIVDPASARASIDRFAAHLQGPHAPFPGARQHHLIFRSLLMIPSTNYPSSPIAALSPTTVSDLLNTRLLTPIITLQMFLPLLQSLPLSHTHLNSGLAPASALIKPSVLLLTPSIISSLSPAFHAPESVVNSALTSLAAVLSAELAPLHIPVTHLQLGTFDLSALAPHSRSQHTASSQRAETLTWDDSTRRSYARNFVATTSSSSKLGRGSSLRELNNAVFDAVFSARGGVVRVGMGSSLYGFIGRWVPSGLVAWMMGARGVSEGSSEAEFRRGMIMAGSGGGENDTGNVESSRASHGIGDSEYISVYGEREDGDLGDGHVI